MFKYCSVESAHLVMTELLSTNREIIWSLRDVSKGFTTFIPNLANISHPLIAFSIINIIIINGVLLFL